jgi:hypothetical protein
LPEKTVCTEQALEGPWACVFERRERYESVFWRIVNDQGRHKAESCAHLNYAAEARLPASRKAEACRWHAWCHTWDRNATGRGAHRSRGCSAFFFEI